MARKVSTGLKLPNGKTIHIGDSLLFKLNDSTALDDEPIGRIMKTLGYTSFVLTVAKHKWLELDLNVYLKGEHRLAEENMVMHIAEGGELEAFDKEYKERLPQLFKQNFDTYYLRFLLDSSLEVEKVDFDKELNESREFYQNASREIYMINEQADKATDLKEAV